MTLQSIRGFKDSLPPESTQLTAFEAVAREVLSLYGYRELRLPTVESRELYVKSTGETTDIVEKEMFELEDSGGRKLALRPEGTPGAVRAFVQHHLDQGGPRTRLFYIGSMFRAERPQAGRWREFGQVGAECFGDAHPAADAELILALAQIFERAGLGGSFSIQMNNIGCDENPGCRPAFRAKLKAFLAAERESLCDHCKSRIDRNPLRVLDCKADGPRLAAKVPPLEPCPACEAHATRLCRLLEQAGLKFEYPVRTLVRGLDYYNRTVFEFRSTALGAQDALAGGGRYDGLVKSMGGPDAPAVGWALGIERTLLAVQAKHPPKETQLPVYVALQDKDEKMEDSALELLQELRALGITAEGGFGHSLKAQMRDANRNRARYTVIFGQEEFKRNECLIKNMQAKDEQQAVSRPKAAARLQELLR